MNIDEYAKLVIDELNFTEGRSNKILIDHFKYVLEEANKIKPGWEYAYHDDKHIEIIDDTCEINIQYFSKDSSWLVEHSSAVVSYYGQDLKIVFDCVRKLIYDKAFAILNHLGDLR